MLIIGQISGKQKLERQFEIDAKYELDFLPDYLITRSKSALIIASENIHTFQRMNYGMIPFWSKKNFLHCDAPIEGDVSYSDEADVLKKRIITHPSFRKPIRENRCVIPADYFIVRSNMDQHYLIKHREDKSLILAGVYDYWKEQISDKELYKGFSMLSSPAIPELRKHGIIRMPLIISDNRCKKWIKRETPLTDITALMEYTDIKDFVIYPIDNLKIQLGLNARELMNPVGPELFKKQETAGIDFSKLMRFRHR